MAHEARITHSLLAGVSSRTAGKSTGKGFSGAAAEEAIMAGLQVNGQQRTYDGDPLMPLLWYLRDQLALTGTKYGCGVGLCGACTVHVNGQAGEIMQAAARLAKTPAPTDAQILSAMAGNLCRCGCYRRIYRALRAAGRA